MARTTVITVVDDIDGTEPAETISFGLDGRDFEIDLSQPNQARLRSELEPWVAAARRTGGRRRRGTRKPTP